MGILKHAGNCVCQYEGWEKYGYSFVFLKVCGNMFLKTLKDFPIMCCVFNICHKISGKSAYMKNCITNL